MLPGGVVYCNDAYECVEGAHAAVIVTEWNIFRALDFQRLKATMAAPVLIRSAQCLPGRTGPRQGFTYVDVGRGVVAPEAKGKDKRG